MASFDEIHEIEATSISAAIGFGDDGEQVAVLSILGPHRLTVTMQRHVLERLLRKIDAALKATPPEAAPSTVA